MKNPKNPKWKIAASLACLALLIFVNSASADVFVSDNFLVSSNTQDVNQELLTSGRQTGTLYPATYDGWQDHHQVGNPGTDVGQPGGAGNKDYVLTAFNGSFFSDLDIASLASGPLTNEFDMYQTSDGSGEWGACSLRFPGSSFPIAGSGEFGFLHRRNGGVEVFQNGGGIAPGSWNTAGFAPSRHWTLIFSDTNGTGSAFTGNGSQVTMINGTTTLTNLTLGQLRSKNLRLGFNASGSGLVGIDNLVISGTPAVPLSPNSSFEYDTINSGNVAAFTTWHRFVDPVLQGAVGGRGGDFGSEFPSSGEYTAQNPMAPPADGNQFLFVNMFDGATLGVTGGVYQVMGPMIPNHTYNLTVAIGSRKDRINSPGIISLVNGTNNLGTELASGGGLPATQDTWEDYTVTYTTGPSVSGDLTICLATVGASTIQANFDNVRLDPPPLPVVVENTLPSSADTVVGDTVVFTAGFSNFTALQWQVIKAGATNDVPGATTATLTLNNVQTNDSGSYRLQGSNVTGTAYSPGAPLTVGSVPAAVNNSIAEYASQNFPGTTNFFPWTLDTNNLNLILGFTIGSGPGTLAYVGDFTGGGSDCNADPSILSDGLPGSLTSTPNLAFCGCGTLNSGVGSSVTYTLNTGVNGMDITNITVFGGWKDAGRDQQKYQVQYSTVLAPTTFVPFVTVDYQPPNPGAKPVVTRTILTPASGTAMIHNVAALRINWNLSPIPENDWTGYSEILVGGTPSVGFVPTLIANASPLTASDVVGGQLIVTASFSNYTTLQWKKNGIDVPLATNSTLTLNNLQTNDSGAYTLAASNPAGTNTSAACTLTVNPAPTAVGNVVTAIATQTSSDNVFTTTWATNALSSSLIYNAAPSDSGYGDFTAGIVTSGSLPVVLTDGTFGTIDFNNSAVHSWVTCIGYGGDAGQYVTYTLPFQPNGYDITNIVTTGGWNDTGRDQLFYTVKYATSANPTNFIPFADVNYNPTNPIGYSMVRATITPASGALASNVVALQFDMTAPGGAGENGYSGYSEIAAYGSPSANATPVGPEITIAHQEYSNTLWVVESPNLIAGQLPSSQGPGVFTGEGCNVTNLTDGQLGFGFAFAAGCGTDTNSSVSSITFNAANGWTLTNIVVYTFWSDFGREAQFYDVSYSTLAAPTTFLPLASVRYNPPVIHDGRDSGNRVSIAPLIGQSLLASNVAAVKFDFAPQAGVDFSWSGYTEIVLQGTNLPAAPVVIPPGLNPVQISGGNLILTGTNGTPNAGYTLLTSTNVTTPLSNWTTNTTGTLDGTGAFSNSIPVDVNERTRFFQLRLP